MNQKLKNTFIFVLSGLWILLISAFLTLAINQARVLINLYAASAAPPPANGAGNFLRPAGSSDLLIAVVIAAVLFLLVFRRPRQLLPVSITAVLLFFVLNLYSGRHLLPQLLIWPSPISLSEQYTQALATNDLDAALRLTDRSEACETIVAQVFQNHQARLRQRVGDDRPELGIQGVAVKSITTFYDKPVPQRFILMQPVPQQLATVVAELEDGGTIWMNLKMSYTPFWGTRYICGRDIASSALERTQEAVNLSAASLPHSAKGYELYSWPVGDDWHYTLMIGTNRLKTFEEITSDEAIVNEDGWVKITVTGTDALKAVVDHLPADEEIFWVVGPEMKQRQGGDGRFLLPEKSVVDELEHHCQQMGIALRVAGQEKAKIN